MSKAARINATSNVLGFEHLGTPAQDAADCIQDQLLQPTLGAQSNKLGTALCRPRLALQLLYETFRAL